MHAAPPSTGEWLSADGLALRYSDYAGPAYRPPLLCLPALTRNSRDFADLASDLAGQWRVICPDLRGRGRSDYARDSGSYNPLVYTADVLALLDHLGLDRVIVVGTSLGGIVAMLLALQAPERIAGTVLNDIGPDIEPAGLARIRGYVGQGRSFPTWMHAARGLREQSADIYPRYGIADWLDLAKRLMCVGSSGRITFDYDMKIAEPIHAAPADVPAPDMWPAFRALAAHPVLVARGELSDILSAATARCMAGEGADITVVTVPGVGHPPTLAEPEARRAIAQFLEKIA